MEKIIFCIRCNAKIDRRRWGVCEECYKKSKAKKRSDKLAKLRAEKGLAPYGSKIRSPICPVCKAVKDNKDSGYCNRCKREAANCARLKAKEDPDFVKNERARKSTLYRENADHRLKVDVRALTWKAIKSGVLIRQPCEVCGKIKVDAHHDDYNKPMEVRWLCRSHHNEHHRNEQK